MAATRKSSSRKRTTTKRKSSSSSRGRPNKAVDRASASLDATSKAFRDLRDELQKGGSKLLKDAQLRDLEKGLRDAGTSFRSLSKRLVKDLEGVQKAATSGKRPTKRKSTKKSGTKKRKSTAKRKSTSATRRASSSAKRAGSSAKRSAKSGAKRTKAAAKGAKSGAKRGAGGAKKRR